MEHTAHHLDVNIPCYRFHAAQALVERRLAAGLVIEHWSVGSFMATLRTCQLYDYDRHRWVRFAEASQLGQRSGSSPWQSQFEERET
jgi:omega-6 fatty acid desaturase (delta-12 desaturase)